MRTVLVTLLGSALAVGPLQAQQPGFSILEAARAEAARQAQAPTPAPAAPRAQMSAASKWTGIGLLIGGGALLLSGIVVDNACLENAEHDANYCQDAQTAWFATGGAVAGAGGVVLLLGSSKKSSAPSIGFGGRGAALRIRF